MNRDRGEYIEDTVIESSAADRLGHASLAKELANLVANEPTPLHVAVYGPWGSGKSSLGVLLKEAITGRYSKVEFVSFNAWKFAREPLQRQFISQVARSLKVKDRKFSRGLYQRHRHTELHLPAREIGKLVGLFLGLLIPMVLFVILIAWLVSQASDKEPALNLLQTITRSLPPALLSASFVTGIVVLMGKMLSVDIEEFEPASEERFEDLFRQLVEKATDGRSSRIVFFIDELDRCSAGEVVGVLETIRTFLDVKGCVFVVAADQQVLEVALSEAVRHSIPDDSERPYYSSGAEYLDKIFQHQVVIPPLYPQRLTEFATNLVKARPGIWEAAQDLPTLVSILIPSHIASPRRVKVLLNAFVSLFKIAQDRHRINPTTTPNPQERLLELAKLSTLRLEFPRFYRDLERHPRLVTQLTEYLSHDGWPEGRLEEANAYGTRELVEAYASGSRPTDFIISDSDQDDGE